MKQYIIVMLFTALYTTSYSQSVKGIVTDALNGQPVAGATIYIPDLKTGTVSGSDGLFRISKLPKAKIIVQIKLLGYKTSSQLIDPLSDTLISFRLSPADIEASEIVITGSPFTTDNARTSLSVIPVERRELISSGANNISSALEKIPGISNISTGNAIGKPVIRGLGYNRIVTIQDGLRQEGQQWGDEHGLEIEEYSADRIEILKGPGSLMYGSDALGGVIHILEATSPQLNNVHTELNTKYSSNGNVRNYSLMNEGNISGNVWMFRGTLRTAQPWRSPDEYIYNSGYENLNFSSMIGINRKWGFTHLHFSSYNATVGLVEGERDTATSNFTDISGNAISQYHIKKMGIELPFQNVRHLKASIVNSIFIGKSILKIDGGVQQNGRQEYEMNQDDEAIFLDLKTISGDVRYFLPEVNGWEKVIGISTLYQVNSNKGAELLIPDYKMNDAGVFASVKKNLEKYNWNIGLRYDIRELNGEPTGSGEGSGFREFSNSFNAISGSAGLTWQFRKFWNCKFNVGRGFRSPNISELSANGVHEGTFRYEIGNSSLKPEISLQLDAGINYTNAEFTFDIACFYNSIDHFIYYSNFNNETISSDDGVFPVFRYIQGNSLLKGFEMQLDYHPFEALHIENNASYVQGENRQTAHPLPFIPACHIRNEVELTIPLESHKLKLSINAGADNYLRQIRTDQFETPTRGYSLFFAGINGDIRVSNHTVQLFITGENILNKRYYSHLSRLKYSGIYNQGRNITFGMNISLNALVKKNIKAD